MKYLILVLLLFGLWGCSSNNKDYVKEHAEKTFKANGYQVVGYLGYQWGSWGLFGSTYGGANVWYTLKKIPDNGILYKGYLQRWGNEIHIYHTTAIDAIKPNNSETKD